jgi:fumarate reductase subunit D
MKGGWSQYTDTSEQVVEFRANSMAAISILISAIIALYVSISTLLHFIDLFYVHFVPAVACMHSLL